MFRPWAVTLLVASGLSALGAALPALAQGQPERQVGATGQAASDPGVSRIQPQVTVRAADPRIRIEQAEPEVILQPPEGEAQVTVDRVGAREASLAAAGIRPDQLVGMDAVGAGGEEVGEITEILAGAGGQGLEAVVVEFRQGFLGLDQKRVRVPLAQVEPVPGEDQVRLGLTEEQLRNAPEYEGRAAADRAGEGRERQQP